jgi:hypothetical protein
MSVDRIPQIAADTISDLLNFPQRPIDGVADSLLCPCCQRPIAAFTQPAMMPGRPDREYAHCLNPVCQNYYNTQLVSFYLNGAA